MSELQVKTGLIAGGRHSQIVQGLNIGINWTIDELISKAKALIDVSLKLEDVFSIYNAVSENIHIVSLDSKGNFRRFINDKEISK